MIFYSEGAIHFEKKKNGKVEKKEKKKKKKRKSYGKAEESKI